MDIAKIIKKVRSYNPSADIEAIKEAYHFACEVHKDQIRLSGKPFISHPLWVAYILADLHLDTPTIIAGLLHDTIEDANLDESSLAERFTEEVSHLVEGVSRMSEIARTSKGEERIENLRKMLIAMARDIRVVLVKLADRLHNMRTLEFLDHNSRLKTAHETLEIYAPLAHRLGMGRIKWELEDLAFMYIEPTAYEDIKKRVSRARRDQVQYIEKVITLLMEEFKEMGIEAEISGRPKHFYSIYKKMCEQKKSFEEIYDILAIRVITNSVKDCYGVLGIVHAIFKPIPGRFKDYIGFPKSNMYQALHTTVIGPRGEPLEIQIKTFQMHRTAEEGIAAHWHYKEGGVKDKDLDERLGYFRQLLDWQKELIDPQEFMESLKIDVFADTVFVFTPKGEIKELPRDSTPIDFAYAIHTDVGNRTIAAKVNGRIVPLRYRLNSGDRVEIITSARAHPTEDWLKIVKTGKARGRIRRWLREEIEPPGPQEPPKIEARRRRARLPDRETKSVGVVIAGANGLNLHLAKCCNPVPDDEIIGYITQGRGMISIHRRDCLNLLSLVNDPNRIIEVWWDKADTAVNYEARISLLAHDRVNLLADILMAISSTSTIINAAQARAIGGGLAKCGFEVEISDKKALERVIREVEKVESVLEVYRSQPK